MFLIYTKHIPVGCGDGGSFDLPKLLIGFIFSLRLQSRHWLCFLFFACDPCVSPVAATSEGAPRAGK